MVLSRLHQEGAGFVGVVLPLSPHGGKFLLLILRYVHGHWKGNQWIFFLGAVLVPDRTHHHPNKKMVASFEFVIFVKAL